MLTINEILSNQKVVVFSYAEDTITITYKPYAMDSARLKRFGKLARWIGNKKLPKFIKPKPIHLYRQFLQNVISDWDITADGKPVNVRDGLRQLPEAFIARLYVQMGQELVEVRQQTMSAEIKKKSLGG